MQNFPTHINDPRRFDYNYPIKSAIVPNYEKGHDVLIMADYSAQEVLMAALISGDSHLIKAFKEGRDMHTLVASMAFGIPEDEVPKDIRKAAKAVTFG